MANASIHMSISRVFQIDKPRRWSDLLRGHTFEDISRDPKPNRIAVRNLGANDLLILHISDISEGDLQHLSGLAVHERPEVVLITGDPDAKVPAEAKKFLLQYGASTSENLLCNVPHFDSASKLADEVKANYCTYFHRFFLRQTEPKPTNPSQDLAQTLKHVGKAGVEIEALVSALRFWIDSVRDHVALSISRAQRGGYQRATVNLFRTHVAWDVLVSPGIGGMGWSEIFANSSFVGDNIGHWLQKDGEGVVELESIIGSQNSLDAAKRRGANVVPPNTMGGAIRLLYEISLKDGDLTALSSEWAVTGFLTSGQNAEMWLSLLQGAHTEAEFLISQMSRAVARAEFAGAALLPTEDERSALHHNELRQGVLQRLISHDVPGQLASRSQDNVEPARLGELAKMLSEYNTEGSNANVQSALVAWQGNTPEGGKGVKHHLVEIIKTWRSPDWLSRAGLALKPDEDVRLENTQYAIDFMDSIIGSDSQWRQHLLLDTATRKQRAEQFWREASRILDCLHHWHSAPTRLFDFYEEA